jgi:peptidoglycan/xylan/chitin deacetylase (PgdA/CDA1 family)
MRSIKVTFVIPAHNAAQTIARSLQSLQHQAVADWRAIVVDDGSIDATAAVVESVSDPRIKLVRQSNRGVSAARNAGLSEVDGPWVVFMDADDWVEIDYLEKMRSATTGGKAVDVVRCGFQRLSASGAEFYRSRPDQSDQKTFFQDLARTCVGAVHCYMTKTDLVRDLGGFDESLRTCEDWDLWQRIARSGARLATVPEHLAVYQMRKGSLSTSGAQLMADARVVIDRGHSRDRRVQNPTPEHENGAPNDNFEVLDIWMAVWCAGAAHAGGGDWRGVLRQIRNPAAAQDAQELEAGFIEGFCISEACAVSELGTRLDQLEAAVDDIFGELETHSGVSGLLLQARRTIARQLALVLPVGRCFLGVEIRSPFQLKSRADAAACDVWTVMRTPRGAKVLSENAPWTAQGSFAGFFGGASWLTKKSAVLTRNRLRRGLIASARDRVGVRGKFARKALEYVQRLGWASEKVPLKQDSDDLRESIQTGRLPKVAHADNPKQYWEAIFAEPDPWGYETDYERLKYDRTLAMLRDRRQERALELACAEGHFTRRLADAVGHLRAVDISRKALERAAQRCADKTNIEFCQLDFFQDDIAGIWDLIVCSEVLYYTNDSALLNRVVAKIAAALAPGGLVLSAHAHLLVDQPAETGFEWDHPAGGKVILKSFEETGGLVPVESLETELYTIKLFKRPQDSGGSVTPPVVRKAPLGVTLQPSVEASVVWGGSVRTRVDVCNGPFTYEVPILMYHRIGIDPNPSLERYCVHPEMFARQMTYLRRRGFAAMTFAQLAEAKKAGRPLTGRPIVISFDDAYEDVARHAWPILERNGFVATVFTVTGEIDGRSNWDARFGQPAKLMDATQLSALSAAGAEIASHLHTHTRVDRLSSAALLEEARLSRRIITGITQRPVTTVAVPYGVVDNRSAAILLQAGFELIASSRDGVASILDSSRVTPRLEVAGSRPLEDFAAMFSSLGVEGVTDDERRARSRTEPRPAGSAVV